MFPAPIKTGLTFSKVIGGVSKTLNVANQLIPLYMQAKPMISNARNAFKIAKEIIATPNNTSKIENHSSKTQTIKLENKSKKENTSYVSSNNNPVFFL